MSSAPGHCPHMSNASRQAARTQSPMSSSAISIEARGHGGFEAMSLPYNDWVPDQHGHVHHHNIHAHVVSPTHRGPQLPPPESLVTGTPSISYPHHPSSPMSAATLFQDRRCANTSPHASHPSFPPLPPTFAGAARDVASQHGRLPLPLGQEAWALPPVTVAGSDASHDRAPSRHTWEPPSPAQPPPSLRRHHQHIERTEAPRDAQQSRQQIPPSAPLLSQAQKPPSPSAARTRPAADGTAIPGMTNLLGTGRAQALNDIRFRLSLRQQPKAARACGFGDRDRRVIDPPPIVQLIIESSSMTDDEVRSYLRYESYIMNCAICDESGTRDASFMPEEYQHQRRLMGSLVGTPFVGQDERGMEGCFFCFSDLSCRTPGAFRLKFTLIMIDPTRAGMVRHFPILTETLSEVFHVYSAKEFPGMLPSSDLAKRLKEQGCIISIKKGNDKSKNARGQDDLSENDDDGGGNSQGQRKRRTVRD
ncbi:hypothetical protein TOPH_00535 [Tolypocladium ophioglossoides CBS 100239]|uniref:Velvet domain-containing protein n=1 Tax=Tolypocladium ophioglossoides (strain CBS 100239) TaxID=1163406 RepID=A0A0L0NL63_TOLOC|nr:hypothetical protein TOPH_00535 [Tolypocladium ophioglossoides CBS 100239]